jgi:hypothetical protein
MRAAVIGGGAYAVGHHAASKATNEEQQQQQSPSPPPAAADGPSLLDQLNRLDALHQQGALTDNEFTAAKAKLLGS